MERVHYRRVADRSQPTHGVPETSGGFNEKILTQSIAAALILIVIMSICLLDYGVTVSARDSLRQALTGETTPDGLFAEIKSFSDGWFNSEPQDVPASNISEPLPLPEAIPSSVPVNKTPAVSGDVSKIPVPELSVHPEP